MQSRLFGDDLHKLYPIIADGQSDSMCLDNALEFLVRGGRSLPHAVAMLVPEAWEGNPHMDLDRRGFCEYHSTMMEPWDGPALVAFTDGRVIGGTLDRNGLRPGPVRRHRRRLRGARLRGGRARGAGRSAIVSKGRIKPGRMFLVDTVRGRVIEDEEIKRDLAARRPYRAWVTSNRVGLDELPEPISIAQPDPETLLQQQAAFGYTQRRAVDGAHAHGRQRARSRRLDGHRHAARGAVARAAAALRLLQAAVRAGHQPADRSDPRAARHVALGEHRSAHERARRAARARAPHPRARADPHERAAREDPVGRRARGRSALPLHHAARAVPRRGRGARAAPRPRVALPAARRRPCTRGTRCS